MLRFDVYRDGRPANRVDLSGMYLFGQDAIPVRADVIADGGGISCVKRVPGACGLALLWEAGNSGRFLLSTTRLADREKPYNLNVELARAQVLRLLQKREDWGLFDYPEAEALNKEFESVRRQFVDSLKVTDPVEASVLADKALDGGVTLWEKIALFHADIFLKRRKALGPAASRTDFGCLVDLFSTSEEYRERLWEPFDFIAVPMPWKHLEPKERQYQYSQIDAWINWAARARRPVHAGPLLSFEPAHLPEWLYIWEHDYETIRDLIYEHLSRLVSRYQKQVSVWKVVSGIHAHNGFNLNFEQLMELTRMSCLLVKKLAPNSQVLVELVMPWGEYYARNLRTIPPMLYADMVVQSGVKFDGFGVRFLMGVPVDGYYVRDLLQISSMVDEFVSLHKALHVTACEVPSAVTADAWDAWGGKAPVKGAGRWHTPWSARLQAEWLQAFCRISISKPFVESICWRDLADYEGHCIPHGGLCRNDMAPKPAYKELRNFKAYLASSAGNQSSGGQTDKPNARNK
ncbi:MAG: endo-1,4-beta-xylanase [Planctomycetota bacterium]|jgi:hypothetical protein